MSKVLKQHSLASLYLVLFIAVQTLLSTVFIIQRIMTDVVFTDKVADMLNQYYTEDNVLILEKYPDMIITMLDLISVVVVPVLFTSNLIVILAIILSTLGKKRTKLNIYKVSTYDCLYYIFIGVSLNLLLSAIIYALPETLISEHSSFTSSALSGNPVLVLLSAGVLAPVAEELVFRFGMLNCLKKINVNYAIIIQAIAFGLLHGNLVQSTYAFMLGVIFGYITIKKNNLLYSIIIHVSINMSSVLVVLSGINEFLLLAFMLFVLALVATYAKCREVIFRKYV